VRKPSEAASWTEKVKLKTSEDLRWLNRRINNRGCAVTGYNSESSWPSTSELSGWHLCRSNSICMDCCAAAVFLSSVIGTRNSRPQETHFPIAGAVPSHLTTRSFCCPIFSKWYDGRHKVFVKIPKNVRLKDTAVPSARGRRCVARSRDARSNFWL
jgi:hypothetical protein